MYWLFPVFLKVIPEFTNTFFYNVVPLIFICLKKNKLCLLYENVKLKKYLYVAVYCLLISMVWSSLVIVFNNTDDFSYYHVYFLIIKSIYIDVFLLLIVVDVYKGNDLLSAFSFYWCCAISFCVMFTIFSLLNPDFRLMWQSIVGVQERANNLTDISMYITRFSIGGYAGYKETILCSISAIFSYLLIRKGWRIGIFFLIMSIVGNFFYGRIGIVMSAVCIMYLFFRSISVKEVVKQVIMLIGIVVFFTAVFNVIDSPALDAWKEWLRQPIEAFLQGVSMGHFTLGESADNLIHNMYFMPSEESMLFGDGYYTNSNGTYYMHTDAGYMRIMLFMGVMGAGIVYFSYVILIAWLIRIAKIKGDIASVDLGKIFFFLFFCEEYKGDGYYVFFGLVTILVMMNCIFLKENIYHADGKRSNVSVQW